MRKYIQSYVISPNFMLCLRMVILYVASVHLQTLHAQSNKVVDFPSTLINFGEIYRGEVITLSFPFRNISPTPVKIQSIHSSCGCFNLRTKPEGDIQPQQGATLELEFDSQHFSGEIERSVVVDFNPTFSASSQTSTITLKIKGIVKEEIQAEPAALILENISPTESNRYVIAVKTFARASNKPTVSSNLLKIPENLERFRKDLLQETGEPKVVTVTSSSPYIKVQWDATSSQIFVEFDKNIPRGYFRENITIWNNSSYLKELVVPVVGKVSTGLLTQKYLEFGAVKRETPSTRTLVLSKPSASFRIENIVFDLRPTPYSETLRQQNVLRASILRLEKGLAVEVTMQVPPTFSFPQKNINISGALVLRTNDANYPQIRVPFFGVLKDER